jgi:hypothetical protein
MSEEAPASIGIAALAIDCTDPPGLAHWWCRLLGGTVEVHPQGSATLHTPDGFCCKNHRASETSARRLSTAEHRRPLLEQPPLCTWRHWAGARLVCGVRWSLREARRSREGAARRHR